MAIYQLPVNHDAGAYARAEGNHDEVLHTARRAVGHLSHGGCVGIVGDTAGDAELRAHQCGERHNTFPRQVGRILNVSCVVVGIRCTRADAAEHLHTAHGLNDFQRLFMQSVHVVFNLCVRLCFDGCTRQYVSSGVHDAQYGVRSSHIKP